MTDPARGTGACGTKPVLPRRLLTWKAPRNPKARERWLPTSAVSRCNRSLSASAGSKWVEQPAKRRCSPCRKSSDGLEQQLEAGDLVGLLTHVELGQDQTADVAACSEQMNLPPYGPGRFAQALAVDRQTAQLTVGAGAPVGQPATHHPVQRVAVDTAQQPPHRHHRPGRPHPPDLQLCRMKEAQ